MSNFIFDMDGTLIDSYRGINKSVIEVLDNNSIDMDRDYAIKYILDYSVYDLFRLIEKNNNISFLKLNEDFINSRLKTQNEYDFMPNAINLIKALYARGDKLFIFTHKGKYLNTIIKENNLNLYFTDYIYNGHIKFERKPNSDSLNYLVEKYNLNKDETYYVGDRAIDVLSAKNAKIKSIYLNLRESNVDCDFKINDLIDIINIGAK